MKMQYVRTRFGIAFLLSLFLISLNAWSAPYISFSSNRMGNFDIYVIDTNGENLRNLTNHPARDYIAAWAPNGRAFAFVSERDGNAEIYLMKLNETEPRRLTNRPESDIFPAWSPDGNWIAFTSRKRNTTSRSIYKIDVNGEHLQQLTAEKGYTSGPAWSPDGEQIVFSTIRDNIGGIYVMDADGKRRRRIVIAEQHSGGYPCWSPDGQQIAYTVSLMGSGIYIMDVDGQNPHRVSPVNIWSHHPAWSPDGAWIAYDAEIDNPWGNPNVDLNIYVVSVDGGKPRQITKHAGKDSYPKWVPEGFLSISPSAEKQTTLWGKLKQSVRD